MHYICRAGAADGRPGTGQMQTYTVASSHTLQRAVYARILYARAPSSTVWFPTYMLHAGERRYGRSVHVVSHTYST